MQDYLVFDVLTGTPYVPPETDVSKLACIPRPLESEKAVPAARAAAIINPANRPPVESLASLNIVLAPERIAVLATKWWHTDGVRLTVAFIDAPPPELRRKILSHMNAWGQTGNVTFTESSTDPQVRISRTPGLGHWSYVGTDILQISADQPTMNLDSFTMQTPDAEFFRVVRHEAGHTLGCPHEHMRKELVDLIDRNKAIAYFGALTGWNADMVTRQVLTPVEEAALIGTARADPDSIMCYQIPGTITKDGNPILGGRDIDATDYAFIGKIYPKK